MCQLSTIFGCFVLLILLLVTSLSDPREFFFPHYRLYNIDGDISVIKLKFPRLQHICLLVSLPFLLLTFVIYSILPELQNMHGYTLRVHVALLFVRNMIRYCLNVFTVMISRGIYCLSIAYIYNFLCLSSLFWLNVICFDTWYTLRQLRSYRINLKKREKKMFIVYSIYAWGISFFLTAICAILDIPSISKHLNTPPEMCVRQVWFSYRGMVYFYVPVGASVMFNICFFIAMTLRIWYHGKQTANQLRNSRSSHDNKKTLTVYVKLSVLLGISWIMQIILWLTDSFVLYNEDVNSYLEIVLWHITESIDIFQGVILFFAFVWKKKIMLLLQKRFGCQVRNPVNLSRNEDRPCIYPSPATPFTTKIVPIHEITPSNQQNNHCAESYFQ